MSDKMCSIRWIILGVLAMLIKFQQVNANDIHYQPPLECYDPYGRPQRCIPEFENAAFKVQMVSTNTCGEEGDQDFCVQTGYSNRKSCDVCSAGDHSPAFLTDLHDPHNETWWQSETMYESPVQVNLTLNLGKSFDITYIRIVFYSPRPESFAIFKRVTQTGPWVPYQYYSATCRDTYGLPDSLSVKKGEGESRALCTSEYSDISPLRDGNIAFSSLEGRPSAINFEHSLELQNWVTATDIQIRLDRLNTFGDEVFGDPQVLRSYFFAIADIAVGARCKCNGHASLCVQSTGLNGERTRVCECKHNTDGPDCERCLPFYNNAPWGRATSKNVHECKPCNCNSYSNKCYFDRHLYNVTGQGGHCLDCQANRDGPNCERCKENFYMQSPDGYCINCGCDPVGSRSLQCNVEGKCQCKPGVSGQKCNQCDANYYNFGQHGCQPCGCDIRGSMNNTPSCDPITGTCACKESVEGRRCKECKPGFFSLDLDNKFGCTPCFCYGHTSECQSAVGYSIVSITSNFNKHKERWISVDEYNNPTDMKYNQFSQSIGTSANGHEYIYFSAPDRFLGDQRASYNRLIKFRLQLVGQLGPNPSPHDVILEGAGTKISLPIFAQGHNMPDQESREYAFRLHENYDYSWQPSQSSRGFMSILSNLTAIKIRATYASIGEGILDDFELQTAHRGAAGNPATWIEQCTCPEGYLGQFCESCAPGYRHSPARGGPFMPCIPCDCNKHAEICDSETGRCICQHNTAGDSCDQCARGYYGNALNGTAYDCKRCPCPENGACMQLSDESVICLECPVGYFGSRCELCSDGYFGDPTGISGHVQLCQPCDCNSNVDPNAVGNCNRTTGECLKCIHNTAGEHCDLCLPGHFGDPLSDPHGNCDQCSCYPPGTEQTDLGISICDQLSGSCRCRPNVIGRQCSECQNGYFNIISGNGCENCRCDPIGSFNSSCEKFSGQCYCKPGVTGQHCDQCAPYQYGFSTDGCKPCECDESGSKGSQCDEYGQCPCNDNVEGRRCDRCKENKYNRHQGCLDCPDCYNLVQDAANQHREKLQNLTRILQEIASKPTVIDDDEFEYKLKTVQEKIDILLEDAKSGAGGGDQTLVERLNDLTDRLTNVNDALSKSDQLQLTASGEIERATSNVSLAKDTIQEANRELSDALQLLQTDGASALARAKDRSEQFGFQSDQISQISREARTRADNLEADAETDKNIAKEANEKATKAYELAKNTINLQKNISDELRSNIRSEMLQAKQNLDETAKLATDASNQANDVYDAALTLFANITALASPEINIDTLKEQVGIASIDAQRLANEVDDLQRNHEPLIREFDDVLTLGEVLIDRATKEEEEAINMLDEMTNIYTTAKEAVALGDGTLKEANNTYHTLAGFNLQVQNSSESAKLALQTTSDIEKLIRDAQSTISKVEYALSGAQSNAEQAQLNAQEAQEKYAEQASTDADLIRRQANDTKMSAIKLRSEADQLNGRVAVTENRIQKLEDLAKADDTLKNHATETVSQAKADSLEAKNQVEKAMKEVQMIMNELENIRDINVADLDALEKRLGIAEAEVARAKLSERVDNLTEVKNSQNQWIKTHESDILLLETEINNIKLIAEALPDGCFKNPRLEP